MEANLETHVHYLRRKICAVTEIHRAIEIIYSLLLTSTSELANEISPAFKVRLRMVVVVGIYYLKLLLSILGSSNT